MYLMNLLASAEVLTTPMPRTPAPNSLRVIMLASARKPSFQALMISASVAAIRSFCRSLLNDGQFSTYPTSEGLPTNRELSREGLNRLSLFRDFKSPAKTAFGSVSFTGA